MVEPTLENFNQEIAATDKKKKKNSSEISLQPTQIPKRLTTKRNRIPFYKKKRIRVDEKLKKGYHLHCFTDEDGRIERAIEAGYDFVDAPPQKSSRNAQDPSPYGKVMSQPVGNGKTGYMMRIPQEWWEEDQANKQKAIDLTDQSMGVDKLPKDAKHCFRGEIKVENVRS